MGTPATGLEPTQEERTLATLAQALSFLGFIPPLVIFLIRRQSRFVSFHALQALLLHIVYIVFSVLLMVAWFAVIFTTIVHTAGHKGSGLPPAFFFLFPLVWLGFMGGWLFMLIVAIVYSIKAHQGEWAEYPILGRVARKLLKIGPGGAVIAEQS